MIFHFSRISNSIGHNLLGIFPDMSIVRLSDVVPKGSGPSDRQDTSVPNTTDRRDENADRKLPPNSSSDHKTEKGEPSREGRTEVEMNPSKNENKNDSAAVGTKKVETDTNNQETFVARFFTALTTVPDWVRLHPLLANFVAEAVGTFIFTLTIAFVTYHKSANTPPKSILIAGQNLGISVDSTGDVAARESIAFLPIGFMLMAMVFTFGYVSGGHLNPAVSLAMLLIKKEPQWKMLMYIASQCGGGLGAGIVAMILKGDRDLPVPHVHIGSEAYIRKGVFAELVYSFALSTIVLHVACSRQKDTNVLYGFAIGMIVLAGVSAVSSVSGAVFNPAVASGLQAAACLVGNCQEIHTFWLYWVSPCLGSGIAAALFMQLDTGYEVPQVAAVREDE